MRPLFNLFFGFVLATAGLFGQPSLYQQVIVPGDGHAQALGVNDYGTIVGDDDPAQGFLVEGGNYYPLIYTDSTGMTASNTAAYGVNNADEVVGWATFNGVPIGFYATGITSGATYTPIVFPGSTATEAYGINNLGQIVGMYVSSDGTTHGFLLTGLTTTNPTFTTIDFPNASSTTAYRINDFGVIVGDYDKGNLRGFSLTNGQYRTIHYPGASATAVEGINNSGQMVGCYVCSGGHSFLLDSAGFSNIDPPGSQSSNAVGINSSGEIVGYYGANGGCCDAFARIGLDFPLKGTKQGQVPSPYTAPMNAVFDHAMTEPYTPPQDGTVTAFTNETGLESIATEPGTYCYGQADAVPFTITGHYTGGTYLCYDNHPGYDYRAGEGTEVYATLSGTIYYPTAMVGIKAGQAYAKYHVLELIPDSFPTLKIYHLHLSTHPACVSGDIPKGADCWPDQPVTIANPAPGCPSVLPPPATDALGQPTHVNAGCLIAYVGKSGAEDFGGGPHLHFEVQEVVDRSSTLKGLKCLDDLATGKACVPIDPYGWYPLAGTPTDPYTNLLGIQNVRLWFQNPAVQ